MTLPPAPLFGSLAYQLGPRSFKSWRWRLTTWRLFTPRQKKGQLISVHLKGALVATIRSASDEGTRQECRNIGSMKCNFSVTFIKSLNQSSIKPCLIKKFSKVLLSKFYWMRKTVIFDEKVKVETHIKIIFPIRFKRSRCTYSGHKIYLWHLKTCFSYGHLSHYFKTFVNCNFWLVLFTSLPAYFIARDLSYNQLQFLPRGLLSNNVNLTGL